MQKHAKTNKIEEQFKSGDLVRITEGPFRGFDAIFKIYDGEKRAALFFEFTHQNDSNPIWLGFVKKVY